MVGYNQAVSDMSDFIVTKGLEEEFIDFVAKADKLEYREIIRHNLL